MREIKFRVLHKEDKFMSYNSERVSWVMDRHLKYSGIQKEYEIMQFTGLYDKNEKEVYEGDILNVGTEKRALEVYYNDTLMAFFAKVRQKEFYAGVSLFDLSHKKIKIIGNIYENPELLEN